MKEKRIIFINCIFLYLFLCIQNTNAQIPIHSIVSDVNSNEPLENVKIQIQNSKEFYTSNSKGYFYLKINSTKNTQDFNGYFLIQENTLLSFFNTTFNIYIYDSAGKVIYQSDDIQERNIISLQNFTSGSYFIKIYSPKGNYNYRLLFYQNQNYISKLINNSRNSIQESDSILFSKENYYHRKLALTDYRFFNKKK